MQKRACYYGTRYRSGNAVVDWIFRRFIEIINKRINTIVVRRRLRDEKGKLLDGRWLPETKTLLLNPARYAPKVGQRKDYDIVDSFIHELSHILFEPAYEPSIRRIERLLKELFTVAQKNALRRFIPKTES